MVEIFRTDDGSHSLKDQRLNETYHSDRGAVQESLHVFIQAGLLHLAPQKKEIHLLEMGFGTGLNALLSFKYLPENLHLHYTSVEAFPLEKEILQQLNYPVYLQLDPTIAQAIQLSPFNTTSNISPAFTLTKWFTPFHTFESPQQFDLVYYDAFGPKIQPELWTLERMQQCYRLLRPGGILVTYCAQGQFRRNLREAGFEVEKLPGPPGKREMTRAIKI